MAGKAVGTRSVLRHALLYGVTTALCLLIMFFALNLWAADLRIPFAYQGDALSASALIKGVTENGWYLTNPMVGAPSGGDLHDYPFSESLHWLTIKLISAFSHDFAVTVNLFYLLTFPLAALLAVCVLTSFGVSALAAVVAGLLFAFLPYHLERGEIHLFLSAYYTVPLSVMLALRAYRGELEWFAARAGSRSRLSWRQVLPAIALCVVIGSAGTYYAFFTCALLFVAGTAALVRVRRIGQLLNAAVLVAVICATAVANVSPTLIYQHRNGKNPVAVTRDPSAGEVYGLKMAQLLLPRDGHRLPQFAQKIASYSAQAPLVNENRTASLGLIGSVGFLYLLVRLLLYRRSMLLVDDLATLNASALLLGTIGGLGSLLTFTVLPQIRCYNRISVFVAFFSFFAAALAFDAARRRWSGWKVSGPLSACACAALLFVGVWDQTTPVPTSSYAALRAVVESDRAFFRQIETSLPPNAMVFQLPYVPFPESPPVNGMTDYDHFRAYLGTHHVRWSYGAMKGRSGDAWEQSVATQPTGEMVRSLAEAGFAGVYISRKGYADHGAQIEREIGATLGAAPLVSSDGEMSFYPISRARQ